MTDNSDHLYTIGLLKAVIITILLIAFGRVNYASKITWIFLAGAIGYSWSIERSFLSTAFLQGKKHLKKLRINNMHQSKMKFK